MLPCLRRGQRSGKAVRRSGKAFRQSGKAFRQPGMPVLTVFFLLFSILLTSAAGVLPVRAASGSQTTLTLKQIFSKDMHGYHTQGFTVTDKYMLLSLWKNDDTNTRIYVYDRSTLKAVKGLAANPITSYNFKHCNDMSYNGGTHEIYIPEGSSNIVDVLNADTLKLKEKIQMDRKYTAFAYNRTEDDYICLSNVKKDHDNRYAVAFTYASDRKTMLDWFPAPSTLTSQALTIHNGLIYLLEYEAGKQTIYQRTYDASKAGTNLIYVYDKTGKLRKTYFIGKGYGEGEGIAFRDNELLVSFASPGGKKAIVCSAGDILETAVHGGINVLPQSASSGTGAVYQLINRNDSSVEVSGTESRSGEIIYQITTGSGGWSSSDKWLPYGTYELKEISPPDYAKDAELTDTYFNITEDGEIIDIPV